MSDKETQIQQGFSKALLDCVEFERDNCNDKPATDAQAMANPKVQALVEALDEQATHRKSGKPWSPLMPKVYTALAALEADT